MGMIVVDYTHVFDDVQFAIDVRRERERRGLTQDVVAQALGYTSATPVRELEAAQYTKHVKLETFLKLCQLFDLHPAEYFDLQKASTIDLFKKLG